MAKAGFVGVGVMGSRMAELLQIKGHAVTIFNRTKDKAQPLLDKGMRWADSPKAVAEASDVFFTSVSDSKALAAITEGPDGILAGMSAGKVLVDMSTVSPEDSRALAAKCRERGGDLLDAPVSGTVATLNEGKLLIMVGGRKETFERVKPLLEDLTSGPITGKGPKVVYLGESGSGMIMKVAMNLGLAVHMLAFSESILLAEKSGIPRQAAIEVMINSAVASPMVVYRSPMLTKLPEPAWHTVNTMQKDMLLALELGRRVDVPLPTTAVANEFLTAARGMGWQQEDFAVLFRVLGHMSGVKQLP
jgi:3-hydroxyisobutyrate dehydrogenase-like beta-hydroxyacid dehydrogenase